MKNKISLRDRKARRPMIRFAASHVQKRGYVYKDLDFTLILELKLMHWFRQTLIH